MSGLEYIGELVKERPPQKSSDRSLFNEALRVRLQDRRTPAKNLKVREQSYRLIVENTTDAVIEMLGNGQVLYVNPSFTRIFGYESDEILDRNVLKFFLKNNHRLFKKKMIECLKNGTSGNLTAAGNLFELEGLHKNGDRIALEVSLTSHKRDNEAVVVAIIRDLTHYESIKHELQQSRENYWALSETATDAILQIDKDLKILFANTAVKSIFGYSSKELLHKRLEILFPEAAHKRYREVFNKYFFIDDRHRQQSRLKNAVEVLGQNKDSEIIPLEISFGNSKSVRGNRLLTCIIRDITQRKKTERKLRFLAYHDQLTSLGNRDLFNLSLKEFLQDVIRSDKIKGALLFLDLDGFKKVNDTLGHDIGDKILVECSKRLSNCIRGSDHLYRFSETKELNQGNQENLFRFGGDEFVILLRHLRSSTDAAIVAKKIIESVNKPYYVEGYEAISDINLGVSIGIAAIPEDGIEDTQLISNADVAMYKAKESGNRYAFFTKEMNSRVTEKLMLEDGLRHALNNGLFQLYFQPIVKKNSSINGLEALLRWQHPKEGFIPPDKFIPIAEESGLIIPIGDWVLETACNHLRYWNSSGYKDLYVSVNLSPKQFDQDNLVEKVGKIIKKTGVNPASLKLEVTESCIMSNPETAITKMNEIKKANRGIPFRSIS
jgi:PAS domain S-box-containing protein